MLDSIASLGRGKITDVLLDRLKDLLTKGDLKPGDRLPTEKELSQAFGVGRSSIREALQVLEHVGLVETRHGVGRFVSDDVEILNEGFNWIYDLRVSSAMSLLEAREVVEVACARLAAERAGPEDIVDLDALLTEVRDSPCMQKAFSAEMDFHLRLARGCGNAVLSDLVKMLFGMLHAQVRDFEKTMPFTRPRIVPAFAEVIEAIRTREPDRAERAMKEHFAATKDSFSLLGQDKAVFGNRKIVRSPHAPNG